MNPGNIIVVPLYKSILNGDERISLEQCFKLFKGRTIIAVKPERLDISHLLSEFPFTNTISFDNHYFKDIHGYNELMMSPSFYEKFTIYNYMLIYQPDAFAFMDSLDYWCNMGYDYIGAPWLKPLKNTFPLNRMMFEFKSYLYIKFNVTRKGLPKSKQFYNKVGNGGFSLRNIQQFYAISKSEHKLAKRYNELKSLAFNEDLFWSVEVNRKKKQLQIPNYKLAVQFSVETYPEYAFQLNDEKLPFGCHAWEKNKTFWRDKFLEQGYKI